MDNIQIHGERVLVEKVEAEVVKEGEFKTVDVADSFIYKGRIVKCSPILSDFKEGDIVVYAKYSPDTHDLELDGRKLKFVNISDILATV